MIISKNTAERKQETMKLFESIKPYLDQGYSFRQSLQKIGRITSSGGFNMHTGWGRDLIEYAHTQGYPYNDYKIR